MSASASAESGWVTLGLVGMAFQTGVGALWIIPGTVLAFLFNWLVIADRLRRQSCKKGSITLPDVLAANFTGRHALAIRVLAMLIILSMLSTYVAAQFNAAGKMFETMLDWPYERGVIVGALIVLSYTISGGFRAVAWTDVVQALLMIAAVLAAICSTADSQLLVSASTVSHDFYVQVLGRKPSNQHIVYLNRLSVLLVGLFAMIFALGKVRVIFDFVLYAWAGLGAAFGPALILILLWRRTSATGVVAGMLVGFTTAVLWRMTLHDYLYELAPAFLLAFVTVWLVSLYRPDSQTHRASTGIRESRF